MTTPILKVTTETTYVLTVNAVTILAIQRGLAFSREHQALDPNDTIHSVSETFNRLAKMVVENPPVAHAPPPPSTPAVVVKEKPKEEPEASTPTFQPPEWASGPVLQQEAQDEEGEGTDTNDYDDKPERDERDTEERERK